MDVAYATDRAIFFNPQEVELDRCLKCACETRRRSPRKIAAFAGSSRIRAVRGALTLCERCDRRLDRNVLYGVAALALPLPGLIGTLFAAEYVPAFVAVLFTFTWMYGVFWLYRHAVRSSLRVRAIDDDGQIGLGNVHPETVARILELTGGE